MQRLSEWQRPSLTGTCIGRVLEDQRRSDCANVPEICRHMNDTLRES